MSRILYFLMVCLLALCIPLVCSAQKQKHKDRVLWTKHVQGKLVGFEMGDYMHVEIRTTAGKKMSFFMGRGGLEYFLADNHTKTFDFTYSLVDAYIEEAGGYQRITRVKDARIGRLTYNAWANTHLEGMRDEDVERTYGKMVDKLILNKEEDNEDEQTPNSPGLQLPSERLKY